MKHAIHQLRFYIAALLGSRKLTYYILGLFALQALWVAVSFKYQTYDEGFHFGIIRIYTDHWWPVVYNQPETYDIFRDFAGEGSKLYHFILSFPQRIFEWVGLTEPLQVLAHRFINILIVTLGLYAYVALFTSLRLSRTISNLVIILSSSLPVMVALAATINYDNALFLITPIFLRYFVRLISHSDAKWQDLALLLLTGTVGALVKFTFLPILVGAVIIALIVLIKNKKLWAKLVYSYKNTSAIKKTMPLSALLLSLTLFTQVYVVNTLVHGTPRPSCESTLGLERCIKNGVIKRNQKLLANKTEGISKNFIEFGASWSNKMIANSASTDALLKTNTIKKSLHSRALPIYMGLVYLASFSALVGTIFVVYKFRSHLAFVSVVGLALAYIVTVFANNYILFLKYHSAIAVHSRYALIVVPILALSVVLLFGALTKRRKQVQVAIIVVVLCGLTQGGGVIPHIVKSDNRWYRDEPIVIDANRAAKQVLDPIVLGN